MSISQFSLCRPDMPKGNIGYSQFPTICISHSSEMECLISKDNSKEVKEDFCIGKCWFVTPIKYAQLESRFSSEMGVTANLVDQQQQMNMCGRKRLELKALNSVLESYQSIGIRRKIGMEFGTPQKEEQLMKFPVTSGLGVTALCGRFRKITRLQSPLSERSPSMLVQQAQASRVVPGRKLASMRFRRTRVPSFGTDTKINRMLFSTNLEDRSGSAMSCDGLTGTPVSSKIRVEQLCSKRQESGLHPIYIRGYGTLNSISQPTKRLKED